MFLMKKIGRDFCHAADVELLKNHMGETERDKWITKYITDINVRG